MEQIEHILAQKNIILDLAQKQLLEFLKHIYANILDYLSLSPLSKLVFKHHQPKSLYLWGDVGRGKSMLLSLFFDSIECKKKTKIHFQEFMLKVHTILHRNKSGKECALIEVVKELVKEYKILYIDEFEVTDIADAMIIGSLFKSLLKQKVILIISSNKHPDDLYKDGLQRQYFLQSMREIKKNLSIFKLDGDVDYRSSTKKKQQLYFYPLNNHAHKSLECAFNFYAKDFSTDKVTIGSRKFECTRKSDVDRVIWFSFDQLCAKSLATIDYVKMCQLYDLFIIEKIPLLTIYDRNEVRRFINLIDILYQERKKLICSAAIKLDELYNKGDWSFEFQRTLSRLHEML